MGLKRNLTSGEIIDQFLFFARYLKDNFGEKERITNVIFMGMGEPFSNYENVTGAIKVLNSEECVGLGARSISVSTAGIAPGIEKFSEEKGQINLAISLHASNDRLRSRLMPINKHYSIKKILESVDKYISKKNRKVMFEYLMIAGVNDSQECAEELVKLMKKPLYMVNIISYNSTGDFRSSSPGTIKAFKKILLKNGVNVTTRKSFGGDIDAACGQLANKT
jgi:23S rRNA (adenine2503-C2)-methyltransferase